MGTPKRWKPRPYQPGMVAFMRKKARCCLFVPMGFGKTSAVLLALLGFLLAGYARRVLVLAPLRVARSTWPNEAAEWEQFADMKVGFLEDWTPEEQEFLRARSALQRAVKRDPDCALPATKALMVKVDALQEGAAKSRVRWARQFDIVTCNYDVLQQLVDILGERWPFDTVVCDESTRVKNFRSRQGGKRSSALAEVAFLPKVRRWINLTGTPAPNGLQDLWGQLWFIDQGARLGKSFTAFQDRFFGYVREPQKNQRGVEREYVKRVPFDHAEEEIKKIIADVCFTLNPKDWFDLKEPIVNKIMVDLPPLARQQYRELERALFTVIEGHEIRADIALAKSIKCLQLAAGAAYINDDNKEWINVHDEKIDALRSVVEEAGGAPVLVAYHLRSDLARILAAFPDARHLDADPQTIEDWNAGKISMLVAHPQSAGHGLSLQHGGNTIVFFSTWWNLENHQQIIERIGPVRQMQSGYDRPVYVHYILARGTVDEMMLRIVEGKATVQQAFLDALDEFNQRELEPA